MRAGADLVMRPINETYSGASPSADLKQDDISLTIKYAVTTRYLKQAETSQFTGIKDRIALKQTNKGSHPSLVLDMFVRALGEHAGTAMRQS